MAASAIWRYSIMSSNTNWHNALDLSCRAKVGATCPSTAVPSFSEQGRSHGATASMGIIQLPCRHLRRRHHRCHPAVSAYHHQKRSAARLCRFIGLLTGGVDCYGYCQQRGWLWVGQFTPNNDGDCAYQGNINAKPPGGNKRIYRFYTGICQSLPHWKLA